MKVLGHYFSSGGWEFEQPETTRNYCKSSNAQGLAGGWVILKFDLIGTLHAHIYHSNSRWLKKEGV